MTPTPDERSMLAQLLEHRMLARRHLSEAGMATAEALVANGLATWSTISTVDTDPSVLVLTAAGHGEARKR